MTNKGLFITFEGADGCGKTTQIELLNKYLSEKNYKTIVTLEPGGSDIGKNLRQILLHHDGFVSKKAELFMYLADRAQHVEAVIQKNVAEGKIVLCDRHIDSTVAYQGYGRGLDLDRIHMLNDIATSGMKPDITFVFDIDVETAQERVGKTKDRMESAGLEFFKRVRQGFLEIAKSEPKRVKVLDATQTRDAISEQVVEYVKAIV